MKIVTATFRLDMREPEDEQAISEMRACGAFRFNGQEFEATSIRHSRNGLTVTAKPVSE